ncbi:MAG: TonB-dependent receptor plug domain-containing protein [Spirochaetota bacterium]
MGPISTVLSRVIRNSPPYLIAASLLSLAHVALAASDEMLSCPPGEIGTEKCRMLSLRRAKKPIRLISRAEIKAAGNYREIPLAEANEAALSERASDVLQKQTGIQVNRAGAPGTQSVLGIRGSSPDQVEYFLEGMPLPKPYNAPLNLETLPLPLFRSVEAYPSFIPSHLPATNIGGAMNFRLREPAQNATEYLTQTYANSLLGTGLSMARLTNTGINFVNIEQSRARYRFTSNNGTPENPGDDATQMRQNEDFSRIGYTLFQRYDAASWKLAGLVDLNHSERGLPGVANQPLKAVRKTDERYTAAVSAENRVTENQRVILFGSATLDRSEVDDPSLELFFSRGQKSHSPQYLGGGSYAYRTGHLDAAVHVRGKYQSIILNESRIAERREGQATLAVSYDRNLFRIAGQANATQSRDDAGRSAFFASDAQVFSQNGASASGLAALRPLYLFAPESDKLHQESTLEIYGQVSSAYRPPTLYERFGDNVFVTPSENLRSENALTNAGGVRGSFTCLRPVVCSLRSEAWLTGAKDYIIFTQNSSRTLIAVNASSAQIWGVENEALINWPERFMLSLRYTYLDAKDYGNIPFYQDKYLPLRPRHHAVAALTAFYEPLRFIGTVEYRGAIFRDRYNSYNFYLGSKTLVDLGVDYVIRGAAMHILNFTVKNLLDDREVDLIGYTLPGRYFLARWTAQW